ncbi:hypothetical protein ABVT39_014616 [Epinephelus coioides]
MKRSVSLHIMLSVSSLLIFNHHPSSSSSSSSSSCAADGRSSKCIDLRQVNRTVSRLHRYWEYWNELWLPKNLKDTQTCAQVAKDMRGELSNRSLSPWKYRLDREENRHPHEILLAECLCEGCIINQREDMSYNSVPVFAPLMVLRRTLCPSDPNKYEVKKDFIEIPVACTCAVPKYAE